MIRYDLDLAIRPDGIRYASVEYKFFEAREVLRENKPTGEYHIKLKDSSDPNSAAAFFSQYIKPPKCEIGVVDPTGILKLEYPVFIIIKDSLIQNCINDIFLDIEKELEKRLK